MAATATTIAAVSTPPGAGGVGMVRISGPSALEVARALFTPRGGWKAFPPVPRHALLGTAHRPGEGGASLDQALLLTFGSPASYTGEDVAEITVHGGPLILRSLLEAALEAGACLAEPGEFTRRAFLNGRMDLAQAEAVAALIGAATERARRVMLRQLEGAMGRAAQGMGEELTAARALVEAAVEFPEEGVELEAEELRERLGRLEEGCCRLLDTAGEGIALREGFSVVIIGAPNVGKSSLLNALLRQERAIVHHLPGTTRDFVQETVDVGGVPMRVADTAGIRQQADPVEVEGILRARRLMERADLLLVMVDASLPPSPGDLALLEETADLQRVLVANKADLPRHPGWEELGAFVSISARHRRGLEELTAALHDACFAGQLPEEGPVVTTVRQREALVGAQAACRRAREELARGVSPELLALSLEEAQDSLRLLTGEVTPDQVLDQVFSRFCIGK